MDLLPVAVNDIGIRNGLIGIIIVTNSSRGHHFVYKYPQEPQHDTDTRSSCRPAVSKAKPDPHSGDDYQVTSSVLGYDPHFLANLLSPKLALCDKRFQLTVDDLTFIGHPVSLSGPEFRQRRDYWKRKASRPPKQCIKRGWIVGGIAPFMDDSDSDSDDYGEDSTDETDSIGRGAKEGKETLIRRGSKEEVEAMTTARSLTDPTGWRQHRFRSLTYTSNPASPASGDSLLFGQTLQHQTTSLGYQSSLLHHPVSLPQTPTGSFHGNSSSYLGVPPPIQITQGATNLFSHSVSTPSTHTQQMSFFHIVFMLKPPELQLNSVADQVYKNIACKLTAALRYEEVNSQYVSKEASKILIIREEAAQAALSLGQFHEQVLAVSSLARAVRSIYDCISADKVCHVVLNDSIDISLQIPHLAPLTRTSTYITRQIRNPVATESPTETISNCNINNGHIGCSFLGSQQALLTSMSSQHGGAVGMGYIMDDYEVGYAYEYESFPILLPYHTLLLLEDPEEILKDIPLDANPTLVKLVQTLVPYQCLDELQYILDCSMAQIYRLASHLIYWRKAKLIDQIRVSSNVYVVAPQAGINEALITDFSQHFPTLSLPNILHDLSTPKSYKAHIPGGGKDKEIQSVYLEMLPYLLRKDLVVQLHTYILILVPEYIKIGCSAEEYEQLVSEDSIQNGGGGNGTLTPTLESPTVPIAGGHVGSAKSADFTHLSMMHHHQQQQYQYQQQQLLFQKQQAMPSQTYRYHSRSSTGPGSQGQSQSQSHSQSHSQSGGPPSAGVPMSSSYKSQTSLSFGRLMGKRQDASSIIPNPGQASELERVGDPNVLTHYFDGQHHVEEILFREQIVAKDLKTVLKAFNEFLILTWA
ncbi:Nitrogen permease regulator 3 [Modicella reniformis]|uniref:Nitrogen permease regulator 3 n=1 Tax=Modicella reniformis TaxID=1440133 RepID=A0A9P6IL01_9FUNG|nr:Nitrogen permease regulator 3 [Modicella reniformis]